MGIKRVILIVLDSVGIGELPDAHLFGDEGSNTLGNIAKKYTELNIPNMVKLGLGNIDLTNSLDKCTEPTGCYGKAVETSMGKDTTTGHWEICGLQMEQAFPTFIEGFPADFISKFEAKIGTKTIGNVAASGTVIINELGEQHMETRYPIVYTSADSVFQIAMHENIYDIERQYEICEIAREMLQGNMAVGRVIARPFVGSKGDFSRTSRRRDFSLIPPDNVLDAIINANKEVVAVGKINDIFAGKGISSYTKTINNLEGIAQTIKAINEDTEGLIFTNLVDFDMHYGHRRDVDGYAKCLMEFDEKLPDILDALKPDDLLMITADHGNDPTAPGTDHTREYIPILCYGNYIHKGKSFGTRKSFADLAATISEALDIDYNCGADSFYNEISNN